MKESDFLRSVAERAIDYRAGLDDTHVTPTATPESLRAALGGPTPEHPVDPADVGASWAWVPPWLLDLLGLPHHSSFAFVTGGQMANTTALAAARHHVLAAIGWDVEVDGVAGSPPIRLVVGDEVHVTVTRGARFLGMGSRTTVKVAVDANGAMIPSDLERVLADDPHVPTIVCCQAGNINTGALEPLKELAEVTHAHSNSAWLHVDGAIGLWAATSVPSRLPGLELADSWSTDAHKWLNVPYNCGITICRHPESHRAAMTVTASYLVQAAPGTDRDPVDWNPESRDAHAAYRSTRPWRLWAVPASPRSSSDAATTPDASPSRSRRNTESSCSTTWCSIRCSSGFSRPAGATKITTFVLAR